MFFPGFWSQIHLLGWKISEDVYNRQYVNWTKIDMGGFVHKIVDKENPYKNVDRLKSKLREHGAVFMKTEECFLNYEQYDNSITFIQYQAGAMGLNLQKANKIIYFTLTDKSELYEQSKKRIHRIGQEQPCFYYILMCRGSVEEAVLQTLEMRKDFTDELFNEYERMEK